MTDNNNELSEREIEILTLVARGKSNKEIGQALFISPNTVKVHLRNIFGKLEVSSRTEATLFAIRLGLVDTVPELTANGVDEAYANNSAEYSFHASEARAPEKNELPSVLRWLRTPIGVIGLVAGGLIIILLAGFGISRWMQPQPSPTQVNSINSSESRWTQLERLPAPRAGLAAAVYESHIYVFGGKTAGGVTDTVDRYNPETNSWTSLPAKPTAVTNVQAVLLGGKIYVPGGELNSGDTTDVLEVFDPKQNIWTDGSSLPVPVSAYALVAFEGKLFLFGGWDGEAYLDIVLSFDPDRNTWEEKSPLPSPRAFSGAVNATDKIFVIGGYDGNNALASNLAYLPDRDQGGDSPWETWPSLPVGRYAMGVANIANAIYVISGVQEDHSPAVHLTLPSGSNEWLRPDTEFVSQTWSNITIAVVGANLYAMGGVLDGELTDQNISFQAIYTVPLPVIINE